MQRLGEEVGGSEEEGSRWPRGLKRGGTEEGGLTGREPCACGYPHHNPHQPGFPKLLPHHQTSRLTSLDKLRAAGRTAPFSACADPPFQRAEDLIHETGVYCHCCWYVTCRYKGRSNR
eukprot:1144424-Rhodomonas_salina.3